MVNPIQGPSPWLAAQGAAAPAAPATTFDPTQLLDQAQAAAGGSSASLYGQSPASPGDLLGSDIAAIDPAVAAAMGALQGLATTPSPSASQIPALPAMGADAITSYLTAASAAPGAPSAGDAPAAGTDIYA